MSETHERGLASQIRGIIDILNTFEDFLCSIEDSSSHCEHIEITSEVYPYENLATKQIVEPVERHSHPLLSSSHPLRTFEPKLNVYQNANQDIIVMDVEEINEAIREFRLSKMSGMCYSEDYLNMYIRI